MRVMLVRNANEFDFGGGERYSISIAEEISRNNVEVIISSAHSKTLALAESRKLQTVRAPWLKHQNFSGLRIVLFPLYILWQMRLYIWYKKVIKKYGVDVVHLQSRDDFIAGTLAGKRLRKRVVWTDHADLKYVYMNLSNKLKNPIGKLVRYMEKRADCVIVVSHNELRLIERVGKFKAPKNYRVIYNGILDQKVEPLREVSIDTTLFVATSRLVSTKGIDELIYATNKLVSEGHRVASLFLGEGPEAAKYKESSSENLIFPGFPNNYLSLVKGSDVFVHPSYNEGFSISLVEAAMLSMPVIATAVGGNPEIVEDSRSGLLVKPKDGESLYRCMLYAVQNKSLMNQLGQNLRKSYEKSFRLDHIVTSQLLPVYRDTKD